MPLRSFIKSWPAWLGALALSSACNRTPADLREWSPNDHDHTDNPERGQVSGDAGSPLAAQGIDDVTLVAWKQNCIRCHGSFGAGDGPQGPMTHARDLTDPSWQAAITDDGIANAIRQGRGSMPAFQLPDATVSSLVRLVRLMRARGDDATNDQAQ
jgi:mono/diheme cytochrome c family protein